PVFTYASSPHLSLLSTDINLFSNDDQFLIKTSENMNISPPHASSPSKYHILNTPERVWGNKKIHIDH
ncbi:unnamed protein product, partial [Rotaria magnacalcarata]